MTKMQNYQPNNLPLTPLNLNLQPLISPYGIDFDFLSRFFPQYSYLSQANSYKSSLGSVNAQIQTNTGLTSSISSGGVTKDNSLGLSGSTKLGTTVAVYDGYQFLGFAKVSGTSWSFTTSALTDGQHKLRVVMSSGQQSQSFDVNAVVDTVANGTFSSTIVTNTGTTKSILSGGSTTDHTLGISGTSEVGSLVKIYDGTKLVGQTKADGFGKWAFTTPTLADGHHDFSAQFTDLAGNQKTVKGIGADLSTAAPTVPTTPQTPTSHTWSTKSGWGSIDALAAINAETKQSLSDVKASAGTQWGIDKANINDAWNYGYTGKGITVAVIDTGVDLNNADITHHLSSRSWNFLNNSSNVMDDNGHGTFVASEIASANNGVGLTGASYDSSLMVLKALNANGSGGADTICTAIRYAVDNGANVINMSLGGGGAYSGYDTALQYAKDHNVLIVMAAGNDGSPSPANPAAYAQKYDNCLAVGALQCSATGSMSMTSFSNLAGSSNSYGFVDAAGQNVLGYTIGGGTASWAGTSMAAPLVAAEAALVWSASPNATASHIAQTLYQTSHNVI
jgi:subtilisin family serine protease